ncbi:MAG TPA: carboxypeptidase-like regulatory domain-containing protein [Pseudacidobacterium sp.]|jgi:hypothetical protein|nr:carboxypeptidase-like regulatory domain-containing protein [Pseudacidobacterium sp.]
MKQLIVRLSFFILLFNFAALAWSQSLISGDLAGTAYDSSGAVIPNVSLVLKNTDSGETFASTSNSAGAYRFALLKPGHYELNATATGFGSQVQKTVVQVGQQTTLNIDLSVSNSNTTVEVNAQTESLLQTDHADISTAFDEQQVQYVPNPGNDLTYVAQVAPGALMNTEQGTGNFNVFGLPGSSNVFTVDGGFEDTYGINVNYSAASNLLLGNNDIAEVTVVSPAYQGQYGSSSGAYVTELTKSGGSAYHGNAVYWWNGRALNANNYFNKQSTPITPRPFDNANQWAASIGGPVPHTHDKLHFFFDNEGIRLVLPTSSFVYIPSQSFQQAVLSNISQASPSQQAFYQNLFNVYNGAKGASQAGIVSGSDPSGCNNQTPVIQGVQFGSGAEPCAVQFRSEAGNSTKETIYVGRVDYDAGPNDHFFAHFKIDKGLQASYTDAINPLFNVTSNQPEYEGQLNHSHIFTPNLVNQFVFATMYYRGNSSNPNLDASTALFPYTLSFASGTFATLGGQNNQYPAGRNVTQYQLIDDLSWSKGKHTIKAGVSFRRADMTNYSPSSGIIGYSSGETLNSFISGVNDVWTQSFPLRQTQPVSLWGLGLYAQDEWAALPNVKITLSLRSDTESNPVCHTNCYARVASDFLSLNHESSTPYNQVIQSGLNQAFQSLDAFVFQPRLGIAWSVFGPNSKTIVRAGIGEFTDILPAALSDDAIRNLPVATRFTVASNTSKSYTLDPSSSNSASVAAADSSQAFHTGFAQGANYAQISQAVEAAGGTFSAPSFTNTIADFHNPRVIEWNLAVQQQLARGFVLTVNYVGNHGYREPINNGGLNAYGFGSLPATPTDPNFGTVSEVGNQGYSNFNGLITQLQHRSKYATLQFNYSFSHSLDLISNGGLSGYNYGTAPGLLNPQNPFNLNANYGNADYDVRHNFTTSYILNIPYYRGPKVIADGWRLAGTIFGRSGVPLSVVDGALSATLNGQNYSGSILAAQTNPHPEGLSSCNRSAATLSGSPCLNINDFAPAGQTSNFNQQRRNQFRGPIYTNADLSLYKATKLPWESTNLTLGIQAFNLLNHAPFDSLVNDVSSGQFGRIVSNVSTPTSILGAFLGGDSSPRQLQLTARFEF